MKTPEIQKQINKLILKHTEEVTTTFNEGVTELFKQNADLKTIGIRGEDSGFNDGDASYTIINTDSPDINGIEGTQFEEYDESDENKEIESFLPVFEEVTEFLNQFDSSVYEIMFGEYFDVEFEREEFLK